MQEGDRHYSNTCSLAKILGILAQSCLKCQGNSKGNQKAFLLASYRSELESKWKKGDPVKVLKGTCVSASWSTCARESTVEQDAGSTALAACIGHIHQWSRNPPDPRAPYVAELQPQEEDRQPERKTSVNEHVHQECREYREHQEPLLVWQEIQTQNKKGFYKRGKELEATLTLE